MDEKEEKEEEEKKKEDEEKYKTRPWGEKDKTGPWGEGDSKAGDWDPMLWKYMFSVKLDKVEPLEKWNAITPFIEEFKRQKLPLSSSAIMFPLVQDYHWRINDGDKEYDIRREKKLKIYSKKVSAGAYSRFF